MKNFPDSEIAKNYHCAQMKTACILNHALGSHLRDDLVAEMKQQSYSLSIDASSDTGLSKMKRGNLISIQLSVIEVLSSTSMYGGCLTKKCCGENLINVCCRQLIFQIRRNDRSKVRNAKKIILKSNV